MRNKRNSFTRRIQKPLIVHRILCYICGAVKYTENRKTKTACVALFSWALVPVGPKKIN